MFSASSSSNEENTQFANFIAQVQPKGQVLLVDMHGLSEEKAQATVQSYIKLAPVMGYETIRFVTGRGNHVNAKGKRGTLYKSFNDWLKEVDTSSINVETFDGYYEVEFKNASSQTNFITPFDAFYNASLEQYLRENFSSVKAKAEAADASRDDKIALAMCYEKGIGVEQSYQNSTAIYIELAKDPDDAIANYEAGSRYFIGKGVRQNDATAMVYLIRSADKGYVLAQVTVGNIYWKGLGNIKQDYALGNKYLHMAAKKGNGEALRKIGHSFYHGWGIEVNYAKAIKCWEIAVKKQDAVSAFNLASAYTNCPGITPDIVKVMHFTKIAAELGDPDAQCNMGIAYFFGINVDKDISKSIYWLELAATNLSEKAAFLLFKLYTSQKNPAQALKNLLIAAENNEINAQTLIVTASPDFLNKKLATTHFTESFQKKILASLLAQSDDAICNIIIDESKFDLIDFILCSGSTKAEINKAISFLKKLITEKNGDAAFKLGLLYLRGLSDKIKPNPQLAQQYWSQGAKLNNTDCLCGLGYTFEKTNPKKSMQNFVKAAELGDAHAHQQLAFYHFFGKNGLPINFPSAVKHYQQAIELSQAQKQFSPQANTTYNECTFALGNIYLEDHPGLPCDPEQAIHNLELAAQNHYIPAVQILIQYYSEKGKIQEALFYSVMGDQLGDDKSKLMLQRLSQDETLRIMITQIKTGLEQEKKNPSSQYGRLFTHTTITPFNESDKKTSTTPLPMSSRRA